MPIFEYRCEDCSKTFELLALASGMSASQCLHCGSPRVRKLFSSFATTTAAPSAGTGGYDGPACGRCGSSNPCGSA